MDYDVQLDEEKGSYSPHTEVQNTQNIRLEKPLESYESQGPQDEQPSSPMKESYAVKTENAPQEAPTGCTKFCRLQFYEQFFRVSQADVIDRVKLSFIPIKNNYIENLDNNPDFYGPFWLLTTIIFLLSSTGNLSRYFANFQKNEYLFKLQLVRYGVLVVYSFGFGFPTALYFIMKLFGVQRLSLPEVICIYGYSFSCFIPIFLLCIIPLQPLQWLLIAYGMVNTAVFLVFNLKDYLDDIENPKKYVTFGLIAGAQIALFLTFKLVFFKLAYQGIITDDNTVTPDSPTNGTRI